MKLFLLVLNAIALTATIAGPVRAGSETAVPTTVPTTIPTEIPASTYTPINATQINNLLPPQTPYPINTQSNCSSSFCVQGGINNTPGAGIGTNIGFTWSPNSGANDLQNAYVKSEQQRQRILMLETRRQINNDLATAIENKQYDRARILAIQIVGAKNYRQYLKAITAGQFPNP